MNAFTLFYMATILATTVFGVAGGDIFSASVKDIDGVTWNSIILVGLVVSISYSQLMKKDAIVTWLKSHAKWIVLAECLSSITISLLSIHYDNMILRLVAVQIVNQMFRMTTNMYVESIKEQTGDGVKIFASLDMSTNAGYAFGIVISITMSKLGYHSNVDHLMILESIAGLIDGIALVYLLKQHK